MKLKLKDIDGSRELKKIIFAVKTCGGQACKQFETVKLFVIVLARESRRRQSIKTCIACLCVCLWDPDADAQIT